MNNVEAAVRAKTLRGGRYSNVGAVHTPKPETKERELRAVNNVGWSWSCLVTKRQF